MAEKCSTPLFKSLLKTNWKKTYNSSHSPRTYGKTPASVATSNCISPYSAASGKPYFCSRTKQVLLLDWWLIKVNVVDSNGFKLGVGGTAASDGCLYDRRAIVSSGEIAKRRDEVTLETVDGITITLMGLINRLRTLENGFSSQVCNHFVLGFPCDWEEFGAQYFGEEFIRKACPSKYTSPSRSNMCHDDAVGSLSISFDDLPVTRFFDHMMLSSGDYNDCALTRSVFDRVLTKYGSSSVELNEEDRGQMITKDCLPNKTGTGLHLGEEENRQVMAKSLDKDLGDHSRNKVDQQYKDNNDISDAVSMETRDSQTIPKQSTLDEDHLKLLNFVVTKRKTRSETARSQQEGFSPTTSSQQDTTSRAAVKQHDGMTSETRASKRSWSSVLYAENIEVGKVLDNSGFVNLTRPENLGPDVATRDATCRIPISNQEKNFSHTTSTPGSNVPFFEPETGNQSRAKITDTVLSFADKLSQMEKAGRPLIKSNSEYSDRNTDISCGVLTRSRSKLKKLTDPGDNTAHPEVPADNSHVENLVQGKKLHNPTPKSDAKKYKSDASWRPATNNSSHNKEENNKVLDSYAVRRSNRLRNLNQ